MKREAKEKVKAVIEAYWQEHISNCKHWNRLFPEQCPFYREYQEVLELVENG